MKKHNYNIFDKKKWYRRSAKICILLLLILLFWNPSLNVSGNPDNHTIAEKDTSSAAFYIPKLDLRIRQVSSENNHLKYRFQVFNYDNIPVSIKDLEVKLWLNDSSENMIVESWYGGHLYDKNDNSIKSCNKLTGSTSMHKKVSENPGERKANWQITIKSTGTVDIPANGGKWVDMLFGVHRKDWKHFDDMDDDFSRIPAYQSGNTNDIVYQPHNKYATTYGNDPYFVLYYKGIPVPEWSSTQNLDIKRSVEPIGFDNCFQTVQSGSYLVYPQNNKLDVDLSCLSAMSFEKSKKYIKDKQISYMEQDGHILVGAIVKTTGNTDGVAGLFSKVTFSIGEFLGGYIDTAYLSSLNARSDVICTEVDRILEQQDTESIQSINADQVQEDLGYDGSGVLIGIIDFGIDWRHKDFQWSEGDSKILYLYDLETGTEYTKEQIDEALSVLSPANPAPIDCFDNESTQHGTHVASIAAGTGLGTGIPSVAPGAELIIVKFGSGDLSDKLRGGQELISATEYLLNKARELGKPIVINMSLGVDDGPRDGSDLGIQGMERLLELYDNWAFTVAAGNAADDTIHSYYQFSDNSSFDIPFRIEKGIGLNRISERIATFEGWFRTGASYASIEIFLEKSDGTGTISLGTLPIGAENDFLFEDNDIYGHIPIKSSRLSPANGNASFIADIIFNSAPNEEREISLFFRINTENGSELDTWIKNYLADNNNDDDDIINIVVLDPIGVINWESGISSTLTSTACGKYFITVASNTVDETDPYNYSFDLSDFSSRGPVIPHPGNEYYEGNIGVIKPNITAPGTKIIPGEPKNSEIKTALGQPAGILNQDNWGTFEGTSASAPHVAGVIALMFQKNPSLSYDEITDILYDTANTLYVPTPIPDIGYGYGRVDAYAAVQAVEEKNNISAINPFITHIYTADPSAHVFEGRVYIYASHDKDDAGEYDMEDFHVFSSADMINWVDHGVAFSYKSLEPVDENGDTVIDRYGWIEAPTDEDPTDGKGPGKDWEDRRPCMWSPDCVFRGGKYYLYYSAQDYDVPPTKGPDGQWRWNAFKIGVAVSNTPYGPFVPYEYPDNTQYPPNNLDDSPTGIVNEPYTANHRLFVGQMYIPGSYSADPTVIIDNDGEAYMFFGSVSYGGINNQTQNLSVPDGDKIPFNIGTGPRIVRLKDNMTEFEYVPKEILINGGPSLDYYVGPFIHKRYNSTDGKTYYYLSYADIMSSHARGSEMHYAWATKSTSDTPLDSDSIIWTTPTNNMILPAVGSDEIGMKMSQHGSIVEYKGDWYVFYHTIAMSYKYGNTLALRKRSIYMNKLYYNNDGTIIPVAETIEALKELEGAGTSAFQRIKAQFCNFKSSGVRVDRDCGGGDIGKKVSDIYNRDYIFFNNLDFGSIGATSFEAQVSSASNGGTIKIYVKAENVGWSFIDSIKVDNTGGWNNWTNVSCDFDTTIRGVQNIVLEFTSDNTDPILDLNWIRFKPSESVPVGYSVALKSQNPNCISNKDEGPGQMYLCADTKYAYDICANRIGVNGAWEKFSILAKDSPGTTLLNAIQLNSSNNGKNVTFWSLNSPLNAGPDKGDYNQPNESNSFYWEPNFDGTISFKSSYLGSVTRFHCVDTNLGDNPAYLYPNSREIVGQDSNGLSWEKFYCEVGDAPIGSIIGFKSQNSHVENQYLCIDSQNQGDLCANRSGINGNWEKFEVVDANNGYIALKSLNTNKYLNFIDRVTPGKADADSLLILVGGEYKLNENVRFQWRNNGDGTISLFNVGCERYVCVDTSIGNRPAKCYANKEAVGQDSNGLSWEKFYCQVAAKQKLHFANSFTGGCLTVSSDNISVYCQPKHYLDWNTQSWIIETQLGNTVKIKNTSNGKYLTVENTNETAFVNVENWNDDNRQKWIVEKNYQGFIRFKNVASGNYLTSYNRPYEHTSAFAILCQPLNEDWSTQKWINE